VVPQPGLPGATQRRRAVDDLRFMTTRSVQSTDQELVRRALRTPRAAALSGIAFSALFITALLLIHWALPTEPTDPGEWLSDSGRRRAVLLALGLVPFAGIAFLWFIAVVRDRIGDSEDRFFATVFLGSGLLFIAMLFASAAVAAGLITSVGEESVALVDSDTWRTGRHLTYQLLNVYSMRMAAVFTIAASTILHRTATGPRWLAGAGYTIALVLMTTSGFVTWIEMLFPVWVFAVSLHILVASRRASSAARDRALRG
jgi:MFS family permease